MGVISYQGKAAAEYACRLQEKQQVWMERCPHRFEAGGDGAPRSVPVRLSLVGKEGNQQMPLAERKHRPVELLDHSRQVQQQLRLQEDERAVAHWIHAVTGDVKSKSAALGECSLLTALQS